MSNDPLYGGAASFLRVPHCTDPAASVADVIVLGIPFDLATTGRAGTRSGPWAVRQASANLVWEERRWPHDFSLAERMRIEDCGDVEVATGDPAALAELLEHQALALLQQGKSLLCFGGDHFVSLPLLRAHCRHHGPLALIHFDAHTDTATYGGRIDHGNMFRIALEEGLLLPEASIQVGIRTSYDPADHPFAVLDAAWVNDQPVDEVIRRICARVGDAPAYLSFDIDCLDPAFAPGTGTPVAGGLSTDRALKIVRGLAPLDLRGMDLVEVAPAYDLSEITALAGATLALEYLYGRARHQPGAG
jgi:agmatinase